ncbi:MAG: hypothetical protein GX633_06650 [Clostridiales bacterium]|nr:hypothetical protein [Clostridiales bacterium]
MRHIFILNPAAGPSDITGRLAEEIAEIGKKQGIEPEILKTEHPEHATKLVTELAGKYNPEICRFYACGGDGTLQEVAAGAAKALDEGYGNAEITHFPCGTGNDFIKIFDNMKLFRNLRELISGKVMELDFLRFGEGYALNLCSAGLDARIAHWLGLNKRRLPVSGGLAYKVSILSNFFKRIWRDVKVEIDGANYDGQYSIIVAANGRYYGGGFYAMPDAYPDDGILEFLMIRRMSRLDLIKNIGKYEKGNYRGCGDLAVHVRGKSMKLKFGSEEPVNADGEITLTKSIKIALDGRKLRFALPKRSNIIKTT